MATKRPPFLSRPYSGFDHTQVPGDDQELTRVGPRSPAGEYLRRFWHPIAYTQQLTDLPLALKIMGEELVLFRDKGGRIGLVEAHCPHRGTSFEYGKIEERGIRCCYHSWLIDIDGKILETPGEPEESTLKDRLYHGAYPVKEYGSIVFAYMGPPEKLPEFPLLDLYERPGFHLEPGEVGAVPNVKPCNWLQIVDNLVDPQHEEFLHATISGIQSFDDKGRLAEEKAIIGEGEFVESPAGIITLDMRRVKDSVWVRNIEFRWPNLAILGGTPIFPPEYGPGQTEIHNPPHLIFWVVPIDDSTSMEITFVVTPEGGANPRLKRMFPALASNMAGRSHDEMQRVPGDYEAQVSQRTIAVHSLEHLATTDRGVTMMRKGLRQRIQMVREGQDPPELALSSGEVVPTYGGDSVLNIPPATTPKEDTNLLAQVGRDLAKHYLENPPHLPVKTGTAVAS